MADRNKVEKELKSIFTRKWKEQEQKEECRKKKIKDLADEADGGNILKPKEK